MPDVSSASKSSRARAGSRDAIVSHCDAPLGAGAEPPRDDGTSGGNHPAPVMLGFAGRMVGGGERLDHYTTKVGGAPDWPPRARRRRTRPAPTARRNLPKR